MAELYHAPPSLLFFSCVAASFFFMSHAGNVTFEFPPTMNFMLETDAYFEGDVVIQLTKNLSRSVGWATYNKLVPLWDNSSRALANLSTHFQFSIGTDNNNQSGFGDGVAFFLAPFELEQALNTSGGGLGLFNTTHSSGSFNPVVAVELDTYKNDWDPDDNHVGVDVNGILSQVYFSLKTMNLDSGPCDENLKNGKQWHAWVDYDGEAKRLQVFILCNPNSASVSKPPIPILSYDIDLRNNLPPNIKVGLSASTGRAIEKHTVISWNFSCEYSWDISAVPLPNNTSGEQHPTIGNAVRKKDNSNPIKVILISMFCSVVTLCFLMFLGRQWKFRKSICRGEEIEESDVELDEWFYQGPRKFSYAELTAATRNFSEDEKLGQGGFGSVYRGILSGTAETVAVKRISQGSKQGRKEYVSEVTIISKLRHRNLVQLLGWCHLKGELLLVYEYLPKGSLDKYIFGTEEDTLNWDRRYSIACDIASALVYLHEEWDHRVVHRDVKASNVMLDSDFNAKLGDFGLARLVKRDQAASHTTVVAGTLGYLAPECYITGKTSPGADVYSFGAVTLEIASGRRPFDLTLYDHNCRLVEWVWDLYGRGKIPDAADKKLSGIFNVLEMERLVLVGLLCSHPDPTSRPTMREVLKILKMEAELPYVPVDLPVAVYNQPLRRDVTSSSSTSSALHSSLMNEMLSSLNASVLLSSRT